jgi:hypothetical protein
MKHLYHITLTACLLGALATGHASSGYDYISNSVDTVVKVENNNGSGVGMAISAKTVRANATAIRAVAHSTNSVGVWGSSSDAAGVHGSSSDGAGVHGSSSNAAGVHGTGEYGVQGDGFIGVLAGGQIGMSTTAGGGTGITALYADATSGASIAYGVEAYADNATNAYAVFGSSPGYAGYFDGNVAITGTCSPCTISDEKTKKNVRDLEGSLDKVMALRPKSYEMRADEFAGKANLGEGRQYGLIAQELETIFPEVVHAVAMPQHVTPVERKQGVKKNVLRLKGVNYSALIPVLIKAIQEQQTELEALKARVK